MMPIILSFEITFLSIDCCIGQNIVSGNVWLGRRTKLWAEFGIRIGIVIQSLSSTTVRPDNSSVAPKY